MAGFPYAGDVGVPSYDQIIAFAHGSGVGFSVSATTGGSHVSGSYHYKGNAVDMVSSAGSMQSLAAWLYQYYPYILELIHSGGQGYFVKNGQKVGASYYGAATVSQHYNHVHLAMTLSGIEAAQGNAPQAQGQDTTTVADTTPTSGCLPKLMMVAPMMMGMVDVVRHLF